MRYLSLAVVLVNTLMVLGEGNFTLFPAPSSAMPKPTMHPSSTVTPTMTPLTYFCHSVLDSKNRTCVHLCFDLLNVTKTFNSPKHAINGTTVPFSGFSAAGVCSKPSGDYNVSSITLSWSHYSVTLNFSSNKKDIPGRKVNGGVNKWYLSSVSFTNDSQLYHQDTTSNATIAATVGHSYKCDNTLVFHLNSDPKNTEKDTFATLRLTDYTVQAFAAPEKTFDFGDTVNCVTEANLPAYIPIIVGCALAGLVLLVLVAYVIGRCYKRKQDDYEALS